MYLDKEKAVKAFMGTGEKNAVGEDLVTFLEKYDPHKYQNTVQYRRYGGICLQSNPKRK